ncbi:MAG: cell division protein ZapA [Bryobacterales bacterium]|nr:cell division protein ZapA [Bryobacterales bacterium]
MSSDSSPRQVFRVNIFNQSLSIASSTSAADFERIASQVDELMGMIASKSGTADGTRVGVLAAMHLADRLYQAERKLESLQSDLTVIRAGAQDQQAEALTATAELDRARQELSQASELFHAMKVRFTQAEQARTALEADLASARGTVAAAHAELASAQRELSEVKVELEAERSRFGRNADRLHSLLEQAFDPAADEAAPSAPAVSAPKPSHGTVAPQAPDPRPRDLFSFDDQDLARGATV